jgi:hypothetical protein
MCMHVCTRFVTTIDSGCFELYLKWTCWNKWWSTALLEPLFPFELTLEIATLSLINEKMKCQSWVVSTPALLRVSLLLCPWALQLYFVGSQHLPQHPVIAARLRDTLKGHSVFLNSNFGPIPADLTGMFWSFLSCQANALNNTSNRPWPLLFFTSCSIDYSLIIPSFDTI